MGTRERLAASLRCRPRAGQPTGGRCLSPFASPGSRLIYVSVKGGAEAIRQAHHLLEKERRGDPEVPELSTEQIDQQLSLAVDRVMAEGSLFDRSLTALALKQVRGDCIKAVFLLRAYCTTWPRFAASQPIDTVRMALSRHISATFKDLPGGQLLGATFDYTHRLLDFALEAAEQREEETNGRTAPPGQTEAPPRVTDILGQDGLIEEVQRSDAPPGDLTREPLAFPASREVRLQSLAGDDEGFLLALGYSTQRGYARTHPFAGEIRVGTLEVEVYLEDLGFTVTVGEIEVTEVQTVNQFKGSKEIPPQFTRGHGLTFGYCERKAMSMALVDRALRWRELEEDFVDAAAQDKEFVLAHADNVQANGFVEHLKLPHYVDFQSDLELVRRMRRVLEESAESEEKAAE